MPIAPSCVQSSPLHRAASNSELREADSGQTSGDAPPDFADPLQRAPKSSAPMGEKEHSYVGIVSFLGGIVAPLGGRSSALRGNSSMDAQQRPQG